MGPFLCVTHGFKPLPVNSSNRHNKLMKKTVLQVTDEHIKYAILVSPQLFPSFN